MGGLKKINLFLTALEVGKYKIKIPSDSPPDLQVATFSLCSHMIERKRDSSFNKATGLLY